MFKWTFKKYVRTEFSYDNVRFKAQIWFLFDVCSYYVFELSAINTRWITFLSDTISLLFQRQLYYLNYIFFLVAKNKLPLIYHYQHFWCQKLHFVDTTFVAFDGGTITQLKVVWWMEVNRKHNWERQLIENTVSSKQEVN